MSYFIVYAQPGKEDGIDGDQIASGQGWHDWGAWALDHAAERPNSAHLAEEGWMSPAAAIAALEKELRAAVVDRTAGPNVRGVTARLLGAVRARPQGCPAFIITDGTPPGEGEEEG